MRHVLALCLLCCLPVQAQTVVLEGVKVMLRPDLRLQRPAPGVAELATVAGVAIVRNPGQNNEGPGPAMPPYLGAGQDVHSGQYGLISREISFKTRAGARPVALPAGLTARPLVGKDVFWVEVRTLQELANTLAALRSDPAIDWAQSRFITDLNRPQ